MQFKQQIELGLNASASTLKLRRLTLHTLSSVLLHFCQIIERLTRLTRSMMTVTIVSHCFDCD